MVKIDKTENMFDLIVESFKHGMKIPLIEGGNDIYLKSTKTYFRGKTQKLDAIQYEIGKNGSKKMVTRQFVELAHKYYLDENRFPDRSWYKNNTDQLIRFEHETRPCNYSVAQGLIKTVLKI